MPASNNRAGVTIRDAYSRCYVASAAYACAVTSHNNRRGDIGGVLCGSAPRLYDPTDRVQFSESRLVAGSNTSTVTLRVVGGDENGSLESETVKFSRESHATRTRE
jgi:hypothetical protein